MADVTVIGAGPAGLMAAEVVADAGHQVSIFEKMPSPGRKFLMAGLGGLNITHDGTLNEVIGAYFHLPSNLKKAIEDFSPDTLRTWCKELAEPTFSGSSGKVFPKSFKTSPLLRNWLRRLESKEVRLLTRQTWTGFDTNGALLFNAADGSSITQASNATVFALGGASWPRLGADGAWVSTLANLVKVSPLVPSNMGLNIAWSDHIKANFAGVPLKSIKLHCGSKLAAGELLITNYGLQGSAVYEMSAYLRQLLDKEAVDIQIDLRPSLSLETIASKLRKVPSKQSLSSRLRRALKFTPAERALLHEVRTPPIDAMELAKHIKGLPLIVTGYQGLDRAISSAGGIDASALTDDLMFKSYPGLFAAGEMLDFDAPTGGYLLQASMSTGWRAGHGVVSFLAQADYRLTS